MKKTAFLLIAVLFVTVSCQAAPTPTPVPTPPPPTPTAIPPTSTSVPPSPTPRPTAELIVSEDFRNQSSYWCQKITGPVDMYCQDGDLHMVSKGDRRWIGPANSYRDFTMQVQARFIGDAGSCQLVFRAGSESNPPQYVFAATSKGQFALVKYIPTPGTNTGSAAFLINQTESPAIKKGEETNTFQVVVQGSRITLNANDVELARTVDASFTEGRIGLGAGDGAHVVFDNLKIWVPLTAPAP